MLGGSGLLLPLGGKGALAIGDLGKVADLPISAAPLPFSDDCLELRRIKRTLHGLDLSEHWQERSRRFHSMMVDEYRPTARRIAGRPAPSWVDCVELAEIVWTAWEKEHRDGYCVGSETNKLAVHENRVGPGSYHARHAIVALVEGVLALGGGERFDPSISS